MDRMGTGLLIRNPRTSNAEKYQKQQRALTYYKQQLFPTTSKGEEDVSE